MKAFSPALATKVLGMIVKIKNADALQNNLKNDGIIRKEMSDLAGRVALRCGRLLAVANTMQITTKHFNFSAASFETAEQQTEQSSETTEKLCSVIPQLNIFCSLKCVLRTMSDTQADSLKQDKKTTPDSLSHPHQQVTSKEPTTTDTVKPKTSGCGQRCPSENKTGSRRTEKKFWLRLK